MRQVPVTPLNVLDFYKKKAAHEKISIITCYDYTSAQILSTTNVDCLLVGDSLAMVIHGFKDTLSATIEMMCYHTAAVHRGAPNKFIIGDLPFMSYRRSLSDNVDAATKLMQAGANALKLECAAGNLELIQHLTESGVPIMGHLGLTPQSVHSLGGYKIQGRNQDSAERMKTDALKLQAAGCFALVLECVPTSLAREITQSLSIPTIGIGAGPDTDGQVLVLQDMLGMSHFTPSFVKQFIDGKTQIQSGVETYIEEINNGSFPSNEHCFTS